MESILQQDPNGFQKGFGPNAQPSFLEMQRIATRWKKPIQTHPKLDLFRVYYQLERGGAQSQIKEEDGSAGRSAAPIVP